MKRNRQDRALEWRVTHCIGWGGGEVGDMAGRQASGNIGCEGTLSEKGLD